jgi:hypothetical protein
VWSSRDGKIAIKLLVENAFARNACPFWIWIHSPNPYGRNTLRKALLNRGIDFGVVFAVIAN